MGTLPASALADLVAVYEDECRRKRVAAGAAPAGPAAPASADEKKRDSGLAAFPGATHSGAGDVPAAFRTPFAPSAQAVALGSARDRGRSSGATAIVGPAGAKHAFTLVQPPLLAAAAAATGAAGGLAPLAVDEAARRAEAEADAARVRERVLKRLAAKDQPAAAQQQPQQPVEQQQQA